MALELEPKTFLGEMYHYFLQGHNLDIQSLERLNNLCFNCCCCHVVLMIPVYHLNHA